MFESELAKKERKKEMRLVLKLQRIYDLYKGSGLLSSIFGVLVVVMCGQ